MCAKHEITPLAHQDAHSKVGSWTECLAACSTRAEAEELGTRRTWDFSAIQTTHFNF